MSKAWLVLCCSGNANMVLLLWSVLNLSLKVEKIQVALPPGSITAKH